jgi:hypothetical protein
MIIKSSHLVMVTITIMIFMQTFNQAKAAGKSPWLEPTVPTRLEWLFLELQAVEGDTEFGENGMTVNFYLSPESFRTGEILCDLAYIPGTPAERVQLIEDGILKRFRIMNSKRNPWARVRIIKNAAH